MGRETAIGDPNTIPGPNRVGSFLHLALRLFDVVLAPSLDQAEIEQVERLLHPSERAAFFGQARADQRHGWEAARSVLDRRPDRVDLARAALLHDVGKRNARLGSILRVVATLAIKLRAPLPRRLTIYRDHGRVAADELARLGAEEVVVEFARTHHDERPESIPPADWELLTGADRARLVGLRRRR